MTSWTRREVWLLVLFLISAMGTVLLATFWPGATPSNAISPLPLPTVTQLFPTRETVVYATRDGDVVLHDVVSGRRVTVLAGMYMPAESECSTCFAVSAPLRASPDGKWLLIPTSGEGTWLAATDGSEQRQVHEQTIAPTWAPDSVHFAYLADPPETGDTSRALYIQEITPEVAPRVLQRFALAEAAVWSPGCTEGLPSGNASCGQHIAVFVPEPGAAGDLVWTAWVVDIHSGERRSIGAFVPHAMGFGAETFRWSPAGDAVWVPNAWPDMSVQLAFPLDGGPALPLVPACLKDCMPPDLEAHYTTTGWRILHKQEGGEIEAKSPAGDGVEVIKGIFFINTLEELIRRSTEVGEAAATKMLGERADWDDVKTQVVATSRAELEVTMAQHWEDFGDDWVQDIRNFKIVGATGMATLTRDHILVNVQLDPTRQVFYPPLPPATDGFDASAQLRAEAFDKWFADLQADEAHVRNLVMDELIWFGGQRAVRLWSALTPFAEQIVVPLEGTALILTKWPLDTRENWYFYRGFNVRLFSVVKPARTVQDALLYGGPDRAFFGFGTIRCCRTVFLTGRNRAGTWLLLQGGAWIEAAVLEQVPDGLPVIESDFGPG